MPTVATFATLLINSVKVSPHNISPYTLVWGIRPKIPFNKYVPLSKLILPQKLEELSNYQKLQEVFFQIRKHLLQRNAEKTGKLAEYMENIHVSDLVLLERKQYNTRIGHKLKPKFYNEPFRVVKKYNKSALIKPWIPLKVKDHMLKRRGKKLDLQKNILVNLTRLKKIKDELKVIGLSPYYQNLRNLADILNKRKNPQAVQIVQSKNILVKKNKISEFYKTINTRGLFNDFKASSLKQNAIYFSKLNDNNLNENVLIGTDRSVISVKTCSYNMETECKRNQGCHSLEEQTNISLLYEFVKNKKKPLKKLKQTNKQTNKQGSLYYDTNTTLEIYDGSIAADEFQEFLSIAASITSKIIQTNQVYTAQEHNLIKVPVKFNHSQRMLMMSKMSKIVVTIIRSIMMIRIIKMIRMIRMMIRMIIKKI